MFSSPLISFYVFPRYALIQQPDQHPSTDRNSGSGSGGGSSRSPPPTSPNGGSRQQPSSSGASRNSRGAGGNNSRSGGGGGAGFFQGIINGLSGMAHHGHHSTHTRQQSSSAAPHETIAPTSDPCSRATPRRSNSDPAWHSPSLSPSNSNLGSVPNRTWNNANNGHHNLPGGWADELD